MISKKIITYTTLVVALILTTAAINYERVLQKIGEALVYQSPIERSEAIIVLSGGRGDRVNAAANLFKEGLGKIMIMSGQESYPGSFSYNAMKNYAMELGVPENKIITELISGELSTWGEGIENLRIMQKNNLKSFILVTSNFHTKRAHGVYKQLIREKSYDFKMSVYSAKDSRFPVDKWWKSRIAKKIIAIEYLSIINFFLEH